MKKEYIFNEFKSYKVKHSKYDLDYIITDNSGISIYDNISDFYKYYKIDKSEKREETEQERDARLLREKALAREVKIDTILKK